MVSDEDFCIEHGRDFMRCDQGPIPYCKACEDRQRKNIIESIKVIGKNAPTPLTPIGMARELVANWHAMYPRLVITADKKELLASRIGSLVVANTLEAIRGFEDYNGKHQIACLEIERLNRIIHEMQHMGLSLQAAKVLHPPFTAA